MSRVFRSERTGAVIYVFSDDHCPPHVHARQRGDGWIARVRFSYVGNAVGLMSLVPLDNAPLRRTLNGLLDEIVDELSACRRVWWAIRRTTCLTGQWLIMPSPEKIEIAPAGAANAKRIAGATYDPPEERIRVTLHDGTTAVASTRR